MKRRTFLRLGVGTLAVPTAAGEFAAWATDYPTRPVRIIVGFAAGGGTDIVARLIGQAVSERLGQAFVIENRPGAATNLATESWSMRPQTATRSCSPTDRPPSTRRSTTI